MDDIVRHAEDNRAARLLEAAPAREHVDEALAKLHDRFTERYYGPLFGALQQRYRQTAQEGVQRLLKKELKGLGAAERARDRNVVGGACAALRAHPVSRAARAAARRARRLDRSVLGRARADFRDELRAALDGAAGQAHASRGEEP